MSFAPSRCKHLPDQPTPYRARAAAVLASLALLTGCGDDERPDDVAALAWAECPDLAAAPFQCATLQAPLDDARPDGPQIRIAAIRHPATKPAERLGAIFFNPGGPGGRGTTALPDWIEQFPAQLRERFDLISWDPRGIGRSTAVRCFDSAADEAAFKARMHKGFPVGDAQIAEQAALQDEFNRGCLARAGELLAHVSTADTARDLERLRRAAREPSLNYLGVSYGTLLGATYANLYPERVRAMVLDGNVDPVAYFEDAPLRNTSVRLNTDIGAGETVGEFLRACAAAGPQRCAFAAPDAATTAAKFQTLAERLRARPATLAQAPGVAFTEARLLDIIANGLFVVQAYGEFPGWTGVASVLQQLWVASAQAAAGAPAASGRASALDAAADYDSDGAGNAVLCSESPNPNDHRLLVQTAAFSQARAGLVGRWVAWEDSACTNWPARAAAPYTGPWNRPTPPMLVIGNTYDPSTAYVSSQRMAALLANARLLTVDGYGHTVLLNPSRCASDAQVRYFIDGTLPPEGTRCRQDAQPFAE